MICSSCGNVVKDGMKFCTICGAKLVTPMVAEETLKEEVSPFEAQKQSMWQPQPAPPKIEPYKPEDPQKWMKTDAQQQSWQGQSQQSWQAAGGQQQAWQNQPGQQQTWQNQSGQQQTWQNQSNTWQPQTPPPQMELYKKEKPKKRVGMIILIIILSLIVAGLLFGIGYLLLGGPSPDKQKVTPGVIQDDDDESSKKGHKDAFDEDSDEESDEDESSDKESSDDESGESQGSESSESSNEPESSSSESSASSSSSESSSESVPEAPKTVTLSCGAEIPLDATSVDLSKYDVDDLKGIEQVEKLEELIINGGDLTDLSPLIGLNKLKSLTLNNVPVGDVTYIAVLPALTYLDIRDTQITTIGVSTLQALNPDLEIIGYKSSTYTVVKSGVSWTEAKKLCEDAGGHLAVITSQEEFDLIIPLLDASGLTYVWLGATSSSGSWEWVTGEKFEFTKWTTNEPSGKDQDGTVEDCMCIWYLNKEWSENDQRNNLPDVLKNNLSSLGYLLEVETISGFNPAP